MVWTAGSTYMWIFFHSKCYSTAWSTVSSICRNGGTVDTESWRLVMCSLIPMLFSFSLYVCYNTGSFNVKKLSDWNSGVLKWNAFSMENNLNVHHAVFNFFNFESRNIHLAASCLPFLKAAGCVVFLLFCFWFSNFFLMKYSWLTILC